MVPCYKGLFCSFWRDILYYVLHVRTIPTYGVYPHYDVQRELNSITLEGTVSFQPLRSPLWSGQVSLLILIFLPRQGFTGLLNLATLSKWCQDMFITLSCLTCFVYVLMLGSEGPNFQVNRGSPNWDAGKPGIVRNGMEGNRTGSNLAITFFLPYSL